MSLRNTKMDLCTTCYDPDVDLDILGGRPAPHTHIALNTLTPHIVLPHSLLYAYSFSAHSFHARLFGKDDEKWELLEAESMTCANEWSIPCCVIKTITCHTAHITLGSWDQLEKFYRPALDETFVDDSFTASFSSVPCF